MMVGGETKIITEPVEMVASRDGILAENSCARQSIIHF